MQAFQNPHPYLSRELFQFQVGETLQLQYHPRTARLWNQPFVFDKTLRDKYLQQAHKYAPSHRELAVDCLEISLRIDPSFTKQIRIQFPQLCLQLAERYTRIAQKIGNIHKVKDYCQMAILLDDKNTKARDMLNNIKE